MTQRCVTYVCVDAAHLHPQGQSARDFKRIPRLAYELHVLYAQFLLYKALETLWQSMKETTLAYSRDSYPSTRHKTFPLQLRDEEPSPNDAKVSGFLYRIAVQATTTNMYDR
jgi:hypothetical protein